MNTLVRGLPTDYDEFGHDNTDYGWLRAAGIFAQRSRWLMATAVGRSVEFLLDVPRSAQINERSRIPDGLEYARKRISELVDAEETSLLSAVRAVLQLRHALPVEGIYPQVAADENGELSFYWLAGQSRLEIVVPEKGAIYVRASGLTADLNEEGFFDALPAKRIRSIISELTKIVEKANPDWRRVFEGS